MGLYLKLLPFQKDGFYSHEIIEFDQDYELFDIISEVEKKWGRNVPETFNTFLCRDDEFEESHYGNTQETAYGEPLKYVKAKYLVEDPDVDAACHKSHKKNWAIYCFLVDLNPETNVALYWC